MCISELLKKWSGIDASSKVVIVTDDKQKNLAYAIKDEGVYNVCVEFFTENFSLAPFMALTGSDLLIVMLSLDSFVKSGANMYFSPFGKPDGISAKYIFVRLDISKESFIQGLSTEKKSVYDKIDQMARISAESVVRVTSDSGTDISFKTHPFVTCSHEIKEDGGIAFLPPSETSSDVITDTANGKIVIDVTVGQLYHYGELLGQFGLVENPVTLIIENGLITDIFGDSMAAALKEKLFELPADCRKIVELGQGLSKMEPTGLIGVDESIIDTCHFGFGNGAECGTHLDVVISNPTIEQIADA